MNGLPSTANTRPFHLLDEVVFHDDAIAEGRVRNEDAAVLGMLDDDEVLVTVDVHQHHAQESAGGRALQC